MPVLTANVGLSLNIYDGGRSRFGRENRELVADESWIALLISGREYVYNYLMLLLNIHTDLKRLVLIEDVLESFESLGIDVPELRLQHAQSALWIERSKYRAGEIGHHSMPQLCFEEITNKELDIKRADLAFQLNQIAKERNQRLTKLNDTFSVELIYDLRFQ